MRGWPLQVLLRQRRLGQNTWPSLIQSIHLNQPACSACLQGNHHHHQARRFLHATSPLSDLVQLTIDGQTVSIERGSALIQACEKAGITIPRFCYHERLAVAGNCRMCLVELANVPKPIASCAMPVGPGMVVKTNSEMVKRAREGVMERSLLLWKSGPDFLLANHPLDCPICDQGGECDLQDQAMVYGSDRSRFDFPKRAVEDKDFGPLVKTTMTRCIQCTRCVRFANEVAGEDELGTTGRGQDMQIGTYVDRVLRSELSGNIIDLCPVGALTSKPYAFRARPWELRSTESVDVLDTLHPAIRIDARGNEVLRVLPRENEDINEEWISDKTRFAIDGLRYQRLTTPLLKEPGPDGSDARLVPVDWPTALRVVAERLLHTPPAHIVGVAGDLADVPSMAVLKDLLCALDANQFALTSPFPGDLGDFRSQYLLNTPVRAIEQADAILLVATHPRFESPLLNVRLRKAYLRGTDLAYIGEKPSPSLPFNFDVEHISPTLTDFPSLLRSHPFLNTLQKAKRPLILVGASLYDHPQASALLHSLGTLYSHIPALLQRDEKAGTVHWHGLSFLQHGTSHVAGMEMGFFHPNNSKLLDTLAKGPKLVYLLNAEPTFTLPKESFVIYQGHHGDRGAALADVVLPGCAYTEKTSVYMNVEGRAQLTEAAVSPPGLAREDWKVLKAVAIAAGIELPYHEWNQVVQRLQELSPTFGSAQLQACSFPATFPTLSSASISSTPLPLRIRSKAHFYQSDSISKVSPTMAECVRVYES